MRRRERASSRAADLIFAIDHLRHGARVGSAGVAEGNVFLGTTLVLSRRTKAEQLSSQARPVALALGPEPDEASFELAACALFEFKGSVVFNTENLKLKAGRGRGPWGTAIVKISAEELKAKAATRWDLLVRTHEPDEHGTLVPFESTRAAVELYDACGIDEVDEDYEHAGGNAPFEGEQQYRSADIDFILGEVEGEQLPGDVSYIATQHCRMTHNKWWERDAIKAMIAHHRSLAGERDWRQLAPDRVEDAVKDWLLPRGRKLCVYFFVPRAMDTSE